MFISAISDQSSSCLCSLLHLQIKVPHVYVHFCICRPQFLMFMSTSVFADHSSSCLCPLLCLQTTVPHVCVHFCICRPNFLMFMSTSVFADKGSSCLCSFAVFAGDVTSCLCSLLYLQTTGPHVYVHCFICRPQDLMFMFTALFADHSTSCLC